MEKLRVYVYSEIDHQRRKQLRYNFDDDEIKGNGIHYDGAYKFSLELIKSALLHKRQLDIRWNIAPSIRKQFGIDGILRAGERLVFPGHSFGQVGCYQKRRIERSLSKILHSRDLISELDRKNCDSLNKK